MCVCVQGCEERYLMVIVSVLFLILCLTFEKVSVCVTLCLLYRTVLFDDHRVQTDWDGIVFTSIVNTT